MNLVPENINEAIKHLTGRSEEDIKGEVQKILDEAGYTPVIKKELLRRVKLELRENAARMRTNINRRLSVEFLSNMLRYIEYYTLRDFKIQNSDDIGLIDYISDDLKRIIEKYNLNK